MKSKIKIVENQIAVSINDLKTIVINYWQSGALYKNAYEQEFVGKEIYYSIVDDISAYANEIAYSIRVNAQNRLNRPHDSLDWNDLYPRSDVRSIGFEVLKLLDGAYSNPDFILLNDDIPTILEFLDTASSYFIFTKNSLKAWEKWEKYWSNIDHKQRKNNLEDYIYAMPKLDRRFSADKSYMEKTSYQYEDGSYIELRMSGKSRRPRVYTFDAETNKEELITFKKELIQ